MYMHARVIDQALGRDGWLLANASSFFAFLWTETKSRFIKTQTRTWSIPSHLVRISAVNKRFIRVKRLHQRISLLQERSWQTRAGKIDQLEHRIRFILSARGASHIIRAILPWLNLKSLVHQYLYFVFFFLLS